MIKIVNHLVDVTYKLCYKKLISIFNQPLTICRKIPNFPFVLLKKKICKCEFIFGSYSILRGSSRFSSRCATVVKSQQNTSDRTGWRKIDY